MKTAFIALSCLWLPAAAQAQQTSARGMAGNMALARLQRDIDALKHANNILTRTTACLAAGKAYAPDSPEADADGCISSGLDCKPQAIEMKGIGNHSTTKQGECHQSTTSSGLRMGRSSYDCPAAADGTVVSCIHTVTTNLFGRTIRTDYEGWAYCDHGSLHQTGLAVGANTSSTNRSPWFHSCN